MEEGILKSKFPNQGIVIRDLGNREACKWTAFFCTKVVSPHPHSHRFLYTIINRVEMVTFHCIWENGGL